MFLQKDDIVSIVSTSGIANEQNVIKAIEILKQWQLNIITGKNVFSKYN